MKYFKDWSKAGIEFMLNLRGSNWKEKGITIEKATIISKKGFSTKKLKRILRRNKDTKYAFEDSFYTDLEKVIGFDAKFILKNKNKGEKQSTSAPVFACKLKGEWKLVSIILFPYYQNMFSY